MELILFIAVQVVPCSESVTKQHWQHNHVLAISKQTLYSIKGFSLSLSDPPHHPANTLWVGNRQRENKTGTADPNWPQRYSTPYNVSCSAVKLGDSVSGLPRLRDWLCTGWLVVTAFAPLSCTLFYSLICFYFNSWVLSLLPNCFPYPTRAEQASGCVVLSCQLGFIHICFGTRMLNFPSQN